MPTTDTNPRLAQQRAPLFKSMENRDTRDLVIKGLLAEGGTRGFQVNVEQMMNYGNARGMTDAGKVMNSGFFGPINRGQAQRHHITDRERAVAEAVFVKVAAGSNLIDYRTDQGIPGDPNYAKEQKLLYRPKRIGGCFFADHPMFGAGDNSWAAKQKLADKEGETAK